MDKNGEFRHDMTVRSPAKLVETDLATLLRSSARGDREAFGRVYDASSSLVFGLVRSIVFDQASAEEITLDVYLQVWRQASQFDPARGSVIAWLLLIARSRSVDYLRSKGHRERSAEQPLEAAANDFPQSGNNPEAALIARRQASAVRSAVAALDPDRRSALELAYFQGLSHRQIADRLTVPLGTVKSRIRSAMMHLKQRLEPAENVQ